MKKDAGKGKAKKKKQKSNDEALEDSDDGDYEGLEVDYMSDESRSDPLHSGIQRIRNNTFVFLVLFWGGKIMLFFLLICVSCVPKLAQKKNQRRESPLKERSIPKVRSFYG